MSNHQQMMLATITGTVVAIILAGTRVFRKKNNSSSDNNVSGDGNQTTSTAITPISLPHGGQNYEVFLNFRGKDTRKTFTDHLYHSLVDVGVYVFRDSEALYVGEEIHPNILRAIQNSKISISVISPSYASSPWCLYELVQILKCRETLGQIVIPIFYHVDPSDVRNQTGSFGEAFSKQRKNHSGEVLQEWKEALRRVASLKVLELNNNADGYEGKLVKQVVEKVLTSLQKTTLVVPRYLVGVEEQAEKIVKMVDVKSSSDVQVVIIHGMGGIGKTTLAKVIYNRLSNHFRCCSFLENIRETSFQQRGKERMQEQLMSQILKQKWPRDILHADEGIDIIEDRLKGKNVLLLFDDVDHIDQLNAFAGRDNLFGLQSVIIVTSRKVDILNACDWGMKLTYELKELDYDQSIQLFCRHAFRRDDSHLGELGTIARDIVLTTGGLPLAIEVIGSFLSGKGIDIWKETLKKLKKIPNDKVLLKLKISYESLSYEHKQIFLDIACLYSLIEEFTTFMYMWHDCDYYPKSGIEVLKSLSLIKVGHENQLIMHKQLRLLGKEIVRQENHDQPARRSRLWNQNEACEVLKRKQGTEEVQVLNLAFNRRSEENGLTSEHFERFTKLRLVRMKNANLVGDFTNRFFDLRWLQWHGCPSNFMATGFHPKNLVVLDLSYSKITEQWGGWSEMKFAEKLKVLKLECCSHLKATPDFSAFTELEILILKGCTSLNKIHPSICRITNTLRTINLYGCYQLKQLPSEMGKMKELRELHLDGTSIREIPISDGFMTELNILSAEFCIKLVQLPDSIGSLTKLHYLSLHKCASLTKIPGSLGKLESLSKLDLTDTNITELPDSIGNLCNLERFSLSRTLIRRLPATIGSLKELRELYAGEVHELTEVPDEIGELTRLRKLYLRRTPISAMPRSIDKLTGLQLLYCDAVKSLPPKLPPGLTELDSSSDSIEFLPNLSNLTNLKQLTFRDNNNSSFAHSETENMGVFPELPSSLVTLVVHNCQTLRKLSKFSNLKHLNTLRIADCNELMEINGLEEVQSLKDLKITTCRKLSKIGGVGNLLSSWLLESCNELKSLPDFSTSKNLRKFVLKRCNNIVEIQGLDTIECLEVLEIHECSSLERIDDLSCLKTLRMLRLSNCQKLRDIDHCIEKLISLEELRLSGWSPAVKFPDISKLRNLKHLLVNNATELREIPNLEELKSLRILEISGCRSLENLPDFSEFTNLRGLNAEGCESLTEFRGLENLKSFYLLAIYGCQSLRSWPDLARWRIREKKLDHCFY